MSILSAAGDFDKPGIVMISPVNTTTKPAPAETFTSLIGTSKPLGRQRNVGSADNEYCVFATQIGNLRNRLLFRPKVLIHLQA